MYVFSVRRRDREADSLDGLQIKGHEGFVRQSRQLVGQHIELLEAFEALAEIESAVIGDVDDTRAKLRAYERIGIDRFMCSMSFG